MPVNRQSHHRVNPFAALELDRGAERRDDAAWIADRAQAPQARFTVVDPEGRALLSADRTRLHQLASAQAMRLAPHDSRSYLGSSGSGEHFLVRVDAAAATSVRAECAGEFLDLRQAAACLPAFDAGLFAYARGLAHWQQRTRFCTACAAPLTLESAGHRACCTNPDCGIEHFPRTDPAIIVIVSDGRRCLLGRGPQWPDRRYSTLAGFVEPGESLEDAVRREVHEESGVRVGACEYHSSQPWPFPASIMLGFTAQAEDPTIRLGSELAEARWFGVDELIDGVRAGTLKLSSRLSVSYRLIAHWMRETAAVELSELDGGG